MKIESRKIRVWLISLGVLVALFLLYNLINKGPDINIESVAGPPTDVVDFNSQIGNVADIGIGQVQKAVFTDLDENTRQLRRKWGFEKLLHKEGNAWDIEKPFMDIFRNNLTCRVTAETGNILLESDANPPSPKEGTLTGNVVIHIIPTDSSSVKESFIYLDDLVFISEMSLFRTDGPVDFVSQNIKMSAKAMELVYNDETDKLEFLRIVHLYELLIQTNEQQDTNAPAVAKQPPTQQTPANENSSEAIISPTTPAVQPETETQTASATAPEKKTVTKYKCTMKGNVAIDAPEQLVFADKLVINNIQSTDSSSDKTVEIEPADTKPDENTTSTAKPSKDPPIQTPEINIEITEKPVDKPETTFLTCDSGMLITPMDSSLTHEDFDTWGLRQRPANKTTPTIADANGRTTFLTRTIEHYADTENTIARGKSELTFYVEDTADDANDSKKILPVKVTAKKTITHYPDRNQVVFKGDCVAKMLRYENAILQKHTLSSPRLQIDLTDQNTAESSSTASQLKHITADGGIVRLASVKKADEKLLSGVELKCLKFDYDPKNEIFIATGPGNIVVDNSSIITPDTKEEKFSFKKPCYTVIEGFDRLEYFSRDNKLIADAKNNQMEILYLPVIDGKYGQTTRATASHIEAFFMETPTGQSKLSTLHASGGVTYHEDPDTTKRNAKPVDIIASEFFYNAESNMIDLWGSESQPALLNGALTPGIKYNLKTGRLKKTKIIGPGML
ncbi:hypothetical protein ACFL3G_10360 [Planctomycetota bacterium]